MDDKELIVEDESEELIDEDDNEVVEEVNTSSTNNNGSSDYEIRKKLIRTFLYFVVGFFVLLFILFILSISFKKQYSYAKIEEEMKNAAVKYYKSRKEELPTDSTTDSSVDSDTLISLGYMKEFNKYNKNATSCSGEVTVKYNVDNYIYSTNLDCGKSYKTEYLTDKILSKEDIIDDGYGLYTLNDGYVYRGENVDNYVSIGNNLWRIVKINSDSTMELILNNSVSKVYWDNRYNNDLNSQVGVNEYNVSRIKDDLLKFYNLNPNDNSNKYYLSNDEKNMFVTFDACIGKRSEDDTSRDGSVECSNVLENQKIALLPAYDYMNASVDVNCINTTSKTCQNYNYLSGDVYFWLITASTSKSSLVYVGGDELYTTKAYSTKGLRPVVYMKSTAIYVGGNGTIDNPYKVK